MVAKRSKTTSVASHLKSNFFILLLQDVTWHEHGFASCASVSCAAPLLIRRGKAAARCAVDTECTVCFAGHLAPGKLACVMSEKEGSFPNSLLTDQQNLEPRGPSKRMQTVLNPLLTLNPKP